jgi:hypothetical protein
MYVMSLLSGIYKVTTAHESYEAETGVDVPVLGSGSFTTAEFFLSARNDPPVVSDIRSQTIIRGGSFSIISLDDYVTDTDNTDAEIAWTASGNTDLAVTIDGNRVATVTAPSGDWRGSETITFRATDPDGLFDEDNAIFGVSYGGLPWLPLLLSD